MKKSVVAVLSVVLTMCILLFAACSGSGNSFESDWNNFTLNLNSEEYVFESVEETPFVSAEQESASYFSLDRNTANYSIMRRQIFESGSVNKNSVRIEEYVNYFNYDYERPSDGNALALGSKLFDCPWNEKHKLLAFTVSAKELQLQDTSNNIVLLIDTSGSMYGNDRLGLIQQAFVMLLDNMNGNDTVSIVTYAGDSRVALDGAKGNETLLIANVLEDLVANGSTNGEGGINKAYDLAEKYFIEGGNNRVILATDGDFNVGTSSTSGLEKLIRQKAQNGIYLSVLGVGMFNTNDKIMSTLANNGNGNYAYLDSVEEAKKVFVKELNGTMETVAKDAKAAVIFDENTVSRYRLLGYDTKMLTEEQFENVDTDAGEIGAGHTVTAVYEVELKDDAAGIVATAELRYKLPDGDSDTSNDISQKVTKTVSTDDYMASPDEDCKFISCVLEFGLILRQSAYRANADLHNVELRLTEIDDYLQNDVFKAQFLEIVRAAMPIYGEMK